MVGIIGRPCESRYVKKISEKVVNTIKNRFYAKVLIPNEQGCMLWIEGKSPKGYGGFVIKKRKILSSHKYSYILHYGNIPKGMHVCHKCDNPSCVAPDHLFLGTHKDNMRDMIKKGRQRHLSGVDNGMAKLDPEKVKEIKKLIDQKNTRIIEIARRFNISDSVVHEIRAGKTWRNV